MSPCQQTWQCKTCRCACLAHACEMRKLCCMLAPACAELRAAARPAGAVGKAGAGGAPHNGAGTRHPGLATQHAVVRAHGAGGVSGAPCSHCMQPFLRLGDAGAWVGRGMWMGKCADEMCCTGWEIRMSPGREHKREGGKGLLAGGGVRRLWSSSVASWSVDRLE
eukprot:365014-Chlamydomonas_euryale.AAC.6